MGNLNVSTEENDELAIGLDGSTSSLEDLGLCLVGRFLSVQSISFNIMCSRIAGVWKPQKGVAIKDIRNGRILFQFFHILDLNQVINAGPWSFGSHPLILRKLHIGEIPS